MTFKAYVHYLRHRFINQKTKCKDGGSYFYKNQKYRPLEIGGKFFFFSVISFQKFLYFQKCVFQKMFNVLSDYSFNFLFINYFLKPAAQLSSKKI